MTLCEFSGNFDVSILKSSVGGGMKVNRMAYFALFMGILALAGVASAHHGTANYDTAKTITVKGAVTDFQFINPHVLIFLDGKDETGKDQ